MNARRHYSLIGWLVWRVTHRVAKKKVKQNRHKVGAAAVVAVVLAGGLAASRFGGD